MKFEEFEQKYGRDVDGLYDIRDVVITSVDFGSPTPVVELEDYDTGIRLPPLHLWDNDVVVGLLQMADVQGGIDLDAIDIDPDNLDETISLLVGCILQMPVRLDHLLP